jgi:hypothetical protein
LLATSEVRNGGVPEQSCMVKTAMVTVVRPRRIRSR